MNLVWIRNCFFLSKTAIFILGLVFAYSFVKRGAVSVFADFLSDYGYGIRKAAALVNSLDALSAVLKVAVIYVSEAYTGRFMAISVCSAAYIAGLVLLRIRASALDIVPLIFAIALIALGRAVEGPTLRGFFDYRQREGKEKCTEKTEGKDKETSEEKGRSDGNNSRTGSFWWYTASIIGSVIALTFLGSVSWSQTFEMSSVMMGAAWLFFILGIFCYYPQEKPLGSPLATIYRVFKAAIKKHRLPYPSSEQGYNSEGSEDLSNDLVYRTENGEVHLLPRHPSFLSFLDKAAVKNGNEQEVCTAEQVRDVKILHLIIPLGITFFAYNLVSASGNTYFVLQASNLDPYVASLHVPIMVFFLLRSLVAYVVDVMQSKYKVVRPLWSMAVGMFCSVLCSIAAWQVERRRLSLIKRLINPDDNISLNIMILTPQFILLGLAERFAEGGLNTFLCQRLYSESMREFAGPCIEMLLEIGKLSSILFAFIFHGWIKDSINNSHLDEYFLMLASLSFGYLGIYVFYAKFKLQKLAGVPVTSEEDTVGLSVEVVK